MSVRYEQLKARWAEQAHRKRWVSTAETWFGKAIWALTDAHEKAVSDSERWLLHRETERFLSSVLDDIEYLVPLLGHYDAEDEDAEDVAGWVEEEVREISLQLEQLATEIADRLRTQRLQRKLTAVAERPGTPQEGEAAKAKLRQLDGSA